ncbi:MAG: bifunctional folylpolyglutamate synthase/dihydrofolate synthase [Alphaproteobacteria bacterium]|uniref:Dihydrofolate synthase/folylpolyglutamate synthase n=1 Tax=Candidatus Nitrobium versatile TaxID=2884831 RepID=A0A953JEN3_9BACT|nr:bifunctional folylpolyglutamate synthase/dihydrofolate synthase [Candidatus Nitrobium versatile]
MSYSEAIDYLFSLQKYGIKLGLERTEAILTLLGNPQRMFRCIHVAGTNGKGSVSAMIASILMAHGYTVGLFTSPHLISFTERIRVNNKQIAEAEVLHLTDEIRGILRQAQHGLPEPTFFEFVTAMAFLYFRRKGIQWAVVETGMGGRLDSTNTLLPEVSVITRISYDHREFLGETLAAIAGEKAGIIKAGIPVVCTQQEKEAEEVLLSAAEEKGSPFFRYGRDFNGMLKTSGLAGISFDYRNGEDLITGLQTPLAGDHQLLNACLAVKTATLALQHPPDLDALRNGLSSTRWPGRLDLVSSDPRIMIDGAHNPDAACALAEFLGKHLEQYAIILVMGIMADKDMEGIMRPLLPLAADVVLTAPRYGRAASPRTLAERAASIGFPSKTAPTVGEALRVAKEIYSSCVSSREASPLILVTGSFYTIGEAMEALGAKATLGTLREAR